MILDNVLRDGDTDDVSSWLKWYPISVSKLAVTHGMKSEADELEISSTYAIPIARKWWVCLLQNLKKFSLLIF